MSLIFGALLSRRITIVRGDIFAHSAALEVINCTFICSYHRFGCHRRELLLTDWLSNNCRHVAEKCLDERCKGIMAEGLTVSRVESVRDLW